MLLDHVIVCGILLALPKLKKAHPAKVPFSLKRSKSFIDHKSMEELRARAEAGDAGGLNTERQSSQQRRTMHRCHPARYRGFESLAGENTQQLADSESHGDTEK